MKDLPLLKKENFRPKKSFGQNFLTNPQIVQKIVAAADLKGGETVVEVGSGFGILTEVLLQKASKVIAIERDVQLYEFLRTKFAGNPKLELMHADALEVAPPKEPYHLVANIPYSITSPLLDHFIRANPQNLPNGAVLLVQKEVAEKICAAPPKMNVLALHVQTFGTPKILFKVSQNNFRPAPKVDSAVIKIEFPLMSLRAHTSKASVLRSLVPARDIPTQTSVEDVLQPQVPQKYFELIHRAFSGKRKMLRNTLPVELLNKAKIDSARRPETLTIKEWLDIANACD
ncbi:ribosomal RNA small subunit methyltransferase A [Candidatus Peregrinibacteria bacterium]|nr:ribosomal RNA small subunit methyltransferase A [Candidatus Peregrinibacteria bacterium]